MKTLVFWGQPDGSFSIHGGLALGLDAAVERYERIWSEQATIPACALFVETDAPHDSARAVIYDVKPATVKLVARGSA